MSRGRRVVINDKHIIKYFNMQKTASKIYYLVLTEENNYS